MRTFNIYNGNSFECAVNANTEAEALTKFWKMQDDPEDRKRLEKTCKRYRGMYISGSSMFITEYDAKEDTERLVSCYSALKESTEEIQSVSYKRGKNYKHNGEKDTLCDAASRVPIPYFVGTID